MAGGTLLAEVRHDLFSGKEGHTTALQVVVPVIQQASDSGKLIEVPCKRVTDELFPLPPCFT